MDAYTLSELTHYGLVDAYRMRRMMLELAPASSAKAARLRAEIANLREEAKRRGLTLSD